MDPDLVQCLSDPESGIQLESGKGQGWQQMGTMEQKVTKEEVEEEKREYQEDQEAAVVPVGEAEDGITASGAKKEEKGIGEEDQPQAKGARTERPK